MLIEDLSLKTFSKSKAKMKLNGCLLRQITHSNACPRQIPSLELCSVVEMVIIEYILPTILLVFGPKSHSPLLLKHISPK